MKRTLHRAAAAIFSLYLLAFPVFAAESLIPVGQVVGLELRSGTVTVAAFDDAVTVARDSGLQVGDVITSIDEIRVRSAEDVRNALNRSDGSVLLTVRRGEEQLQLRLEPAISREGPKLGIYLRQGITGLGTVTFCDPQTGQFGTLGHGVSDSGGGLLPMTEGKVYPAQVIRIQKGQSGAPGQLRGSLDGSQILGVLEKNTHRGVFGTVRPAWDGESIPVAAAQEVRIGSATIRSTIDGSGPRDYSVEIVKIYPKTRADGRNLLLRVTDPELLAATGGIVQGMSGSPIIQDGKLIGAVTHVLVNSPDTGYGIFIEKMLDAAS